MTFIITPTDPLAAAVGDRERELFKTLSKICSDGTYTPEQVANAGINLVCNAVRQGCATRKEAESTYDDLVARMKGVLLEQHYDAVTGRRRTTFAFDQRIVMPHNDFRDKSGWD